MRPKLRSSALAGPSSSPAARLRWACPMPSTWLQRSSRRASSSICAAWAAQRWRPVARYAIALAASPDHAPPPGQDARPDHTAADVGTRPKKPSANAAGWAGGRGVVGRRGRAACSMRLSAGRTAGDAKATVSTPGDPQQTAQHETRHGYCLTTTLRNRIQKPPLANAPATDQPRYPRLVRRSQKTMRRVLPR